MSTGILYNVAVEIPRFSVHEDPKKKFTVYQIDVRVGNRIYSIHRRFREFETLHDKVLASVENKFCIKELVTIFYGNLPVDILEFLELNSISQHVAFCDKQNIMQENTEFNASLNKPDIYHPMIGIQEINTNNIYQFKKELKNDIILKGIFYEFL